jgi:hypothetical protein
MRFRAVVERFGIKPGRFNWLAKPIKTILLKNVCIVKTGEVVADHVWFTVGIMSEFDRLSPGDFVEFNARVADYTKGYHKDNFDFKLSNPTKIEWVGNAETGILED